MDDGAGQHELGAIQVWGGIISFVNMSILSRICTAGI